LFESIHHGSHRVHLNNELLFFLGQIVDAFLVETEELTVDDVNLMVLCDLHLEPVEVKLGIKESITCSNSFLDIIGDQVRLILYLNGRFENLFRRVTPIDLAETPFRIALP